MTMNQDNEVSVEQITKPGMGLHWESHAEPSPNRGYFSLKISEFKRILASTQFAHLEVSPEVKR